MNNSSSCLKIFATIFLLLSISNTTACGRKEKNSTSDSKQCPDGATLIGDACVSGVQSGAQPENGSSGDTPSPVIPIVTGNPLPPLVPPPVPKPTPSPIPDPTDGTGGENSGDDGDDGNAHLDPIYFEVKVPIYTARFYSELETEARTLVLDHDADEIMCSHDSGITFDHCADEISHVFSIEDYINNRSQVIRFVRTDGEHSFHEDFTFSPQSEDQLPVTFVPCDHVFGSDDSVEVLSNLFSSATDSNQDGKISICVEQDVDIGTSQNLNISVNRLWIIGHSSERPLFKNTNVNSAVAPCGDNRNRLFLTTGKSLALVNIRLQTYGCRGSALEIIGTQNMEFLIENSELSAYGIEADALSVLSTQGSTVGYISQSKLQAFGGERINFYPNGLAVNQIAGVVDINITDSEVRSDDDNAIHLLGGTLRITDSQVLAIAAQSSAIYAESNTNRNINIKVDNSILKADSFVIIQKTSNTANQENKIEVNKTRFSASGTNTKAISFQGEPKYRIFDSTDNKNHACSDNGRMTDWLSGIQSSGSFLVANQHSIDDDCE